MRRTVPLTLLLLLLGACRNASPPPTTAPQPELRDLVTGCGAGDVYIDVTCRADEGSDAYAVTRGLAAVKAHPCLLRLYQEETLWSVDAMTDADGARRCYLIGGSVRPGADGMNKESLDFRSREPLDGAPGDGAPCACQPGRFLVEEGRVAPTGGASEGSAASPEAALKAAKRDPEEEPEQRADDHLGDP